MRVTGPQRLSELDRTVTYAGISYDTQNVAPHAATSRGQITVATGCSFKVTSALAHVSRATAATTAGLIKARIVSPAGDVIIGVTERGNAVGNGRTIAIGDGPTGGEGATFEMFTQDGSTGGTVDYMVSLNGMEYSYS